MSDPLNAECFVFILYYIYTFFHPMYAEEPTNIYTAFVKSEQKLSLNQPYIYLYVVIFM